MQLHHMVETIRLRNVLRKEVLMNVITLHSEKIALQEAS
jgi:hypothetical protein